MPGYMPGGKKSAQWYITTVDAFKNSIQMPLWTGVYISYSNMDTVLVNYALVLSSWTLGSYEWNRIDRKYFCGI